MSLTATALICLSLNLYHESRGLKVMEQYAVAMVTMNRAQNDKSRVCKVVFKPRQFSWTNAGTVTKRGGKILVARHMQPHDLDAWERAKKISAVVLKGRMRDFTNGSTHYHHVRVSPGWAKRLKKTGKHGPHVFFK